MTIAVWVIAVVALSLAGWIRAAGSAISRVPRADAHRDASEDVKGARRVASLIDEREVITPPVAAVGSALLVIAAALGTAVVAHGADLGPAVIFGVLVFAVVFVVGDLAPRQLGRLRPRLIAYRSGRLLSAAVRVGGWASDLVTEGNGDAEGEDEPIPEEVEHEREMIHSVLEFGETMVREVMTPRPDMVMVPVNANLSEVVAITTEEGFSRIPVVSDGDVVGMVIVKDLLPMLGHGEHDLSVAQVMRPVEFIPETKLASVLLGEMQAGHVHQMVVVDEYGEVAGLVTIEDLLEELVGEIADETDEDETFLTARRDGGWDVDARLAVSELEDVTGVELPDEEWDTVGGLVLGIAERVPDEGEQFNLGPLSMTVTRMQGRRVAEVTVNLVETGESAEAG